MKHTTQLDYKALFLFLHLMLVNEYQCSSHVLDKGSSTLCIIQFPSILLGTFS